MKAAGDIGGKSMEPSTRIVGKRDILVSIGFALILLTMPLAASIVGGDRSAPWIPTDRITHVHADPGNSDFGSSIDVHQDTAVVANPTQQTVHVYENTHGLWTETATLTGPNGFGESVAIQGDVIAVGAPWVSQLHLYEKHDDDWEQLPVLERPDQGCFGYSVALDESRLITGDVCNTETVSIFAETAQGWELEEELTVPGNVGIVLTLALEDDTAVIGTGIDAYTFTRGSSDWTLEGEVEAYRSQTIALDEGTLVLGAPGADEGIEVFERADDGWTKTTQLSPGDLSPVQHWEEFGESAAIDGDTIVIGATSDDQTIDQPSLDDSVPQFCQTLASTPICIPTQPGAAYVFERTGEGQWEQTEKVTPPTPADRRYWFGTDVAIDETSGHLLIGAPGDLRYTWQATLDVADTVYAFMAAEVTQG